MNESFSRVVFVVVYRLPNDTQQQDIEFNTPEAANAFYQSILKNGGVALVIRERRNS